LLAELIQIGYEKKGRILAANQTKQKGRINFASAKNFFEYPDFLEIQLKSFQEYFQLDTTPENRANEGLY